MHPDESTAGILRNEPVNPHHWVAKYADYLYAFAYSRIDNEELARDLVQETFLAALQRLDKFEGKSNEKTWLTAILKYKVIDVYRKKSSGLLAKESISTAENEQNDFFDADTGHWTTAKSPEAFGFEQPDALENKELKGILMKCMEKLPALWLSVFTMKHLDDEPTEAICTALKVTPSNYWIIIHRAKLNLRACIQKNWR